MKGKIGNRLAAFQNSPALIEEGREAWFESCLEALGNEMGTFAKMDSEFAAEGSFWPDPESYRAQYRPYKVKNGVLFVPVTGVLLNDFPYTFGGYATGYEYIYEAVKRGMEDGDVKGIAYVIDSGGGAVAKNFDLNDKLYAYRGVKPMRAYAAEHAYSAAYSIASVADTITVARTGGVGSIGVVVVHMEMSKMLEQNGITTTIIRSKPNKMEGNAYEALSDEAASRIQERVDAFHSQFVAMVARNRNMSVSAVDATAALTFMAPQAVANGLADEIGNHEDAITAFMATLNSEEGDEQMGDYTKAQYDAAVAEAAQSARADAEKAAAETATAAVATERERIQAIIGSEEGQKRPKMAMKMALNEKLMALDAESISGLLADMQVEGSSETTKTAGAPDGMLKDAMKNGKGNKPDISAEAGDDDPKELSRAARSSGMVA